MSQKPTVEPLLVEAIKNLFQNKASNLGIAKTDRQETSHLFEWQWNLIQEMFSLKCIDSPFYNSLTSAFYDIHTYKHLDDPTFSLSLDRHLSAIGVPLEERQKATKAISEVIKELGGEKFEEKAVGWNPQMKEIEDITRNADRRKAEVTTPFTGGGPAPAKDEIG